MKLGALSIKYRNHNISHPVWKAFGGATLLAVVAGLAWGWQDFVRYMKIRSM